MNIKALVEDTSELISIAAARLDAAGLLLEANAGFLRLLGDRASRAIGTNVAHFFIQPGYAALAAAATGDVTDGYQGLLTIGEVSGKTRTLRGRVWRADGEVRLLAEFNIEELEKLNERMIELNNDLAISQRALAQANIALKRREARIVEASLTDALTGVGNRRRLDQALAAEMSRVRRTGGKLAALMADLDHFKDVNDRYGHGAGDKVLTRFGEILRAQTRPTDTVARYGGEEFVLLLPHVDLARAAALGERIRRLVAAETIAPLAVPITASFGAAELRADDNADAFIDRADEALYRAKQEGRNRVAIELPASRGPASVATG
ncbi:MAG: diguanylate cyclase [Burkholderiales bacterium]